MYIERELRQFVIVKNVEVSVFLKFIFLLINLISDQFYQLTKL